MNKKTELSRERMQESFEQKEKINKFIRDLLGKDPEDIDGKLLCMNLSIVLGELIHNSFCDEEDRSKALNFINSIFNLSKDVLNNGKFKKRGIDD